MHRFSWDLHFDPIGDEARGRGGDGDATGAVPHRTYPTVNAPWAPPGAYTVRLTVDGKTYTQPITLPLDPRVKTPAAGLAQLATLSREMYDGAVATHAAYVEARALVGRSTRRRAGRRGVQGAGRFARAGAGARPAGFRRRAVPRRRPR